MTSVVSQKTDTSQNLLQRIKELEHEREHLLQRLSTDQESTTRSTPIRLHEELHALRTVFDAVDDAMMVVRQDHTIVQSNKSAQRKYRISPSDDPPYCYTATRQRKIPCTGRSYPCPLTIVKKTGEKFSTVHKHKKTDGQFTWFEIIASPIFYENGDFFGIIKQIRDITPLAKAEIAVTESESSISSVLNAITESAFIMDTNGTIIAMNEITAKRLGFPLSEIIGKDIYTLVSPSVAKYRQKKVNRVIRTGKPYQFQDIRNGRTIHNSIYPIFDKNNTVHRLAVFGYDITEEKNANKVLQSTLEEVQLFKSIINRSPVIVFIWQIAEDWPVEFVSHNIQQFGYTVEDFTSGKIKWQDIIYKEDRFRLEIELADHLKKGHYEFSQQYRLITKSGDIRWIEDRNKILRDESGAMTHMQGIIIDITEGKKSEIALCESEELYRTLVMASPNAITATDLKGRVLEVTLKTLELHGFHNSDDIIGKNALDFIAPEDREKARSDFIKIYEIGYINDAEYTFLRNDGSRFLGELNVAIVRNAEGKPKGFISTTRDITDRRRFENDLLESEEKFRQFFENEPDYCYMLSNDGRILDVNSAALRILGYTKNELVGKSISMVYTPKSRKRMKQLLSHWHVTGEIRDTEMEIKTKKGKRRYISLSAVAVRDKNGHPLYSVSVQRDITDRIKNEKSIARYAETQSVLLQEVNHRVKNNLTAIISMLHKEEDYATQAGASAVPPILQDLEGRIRGLATVHSLLSASNWQPIRISNLFAQVVHAALQSLPRHNHVRLKIEPSFIKANSNQAHNLTLIFNELVTNTFKHALARKNRITITFKIFEDNDRLTLFYKDSGPGYPKEMINGNTQFNAVGFDLIDGIVTKNLKGILRLSNNKGALTRIQFNHKS